MTLIRLKILMVCLGISLVLCAGPIQGEEKHKSSKKSPTTQPAPESHYMIMMPDENPHNTTEVPPSIASPERIMKEKPEGDKKSLNQ